ncbi:MAG: hypothetical protein IKC23_05070 [Fibrobacter sp.]|nr:hypothetical protein [Fibrobacter sp.]
MSDSLQVAIQQNTASVMALTGTLWVFMGVTCFLVAGYFFIRYTLRG